MASKAIMPELRAVQQVLNALEPFNPAEQKRVVMVACALLGRDWISGYLPTATARRLLSVAQSAIRKVS
jgi:hypothetical protein